MGTLDESNNLPNSRNDFVKRKNNTKKIIIFLAFFLLLFLAIYLLFIYVKAQKELNYLKDPVAQEAISKIENDKLIITISKLIELPVDEEPIIGTIQDAESLSQQQKFFSNSKNGDKVLIYKDQAFVYRPSDNKLVKVGPVYANSTSTESILNSK